MMIEKEGKTERGGRDRHQLLGLKEWDKEEGSREKRER